MNRILIIDDELGVSRLIGETLRRAGYVVDTTFSGREGIHRFDSDFFDLVITDMGMPDLDGRGVVRHIRHSSRPFTPIIGISGTPWLLNDIDCDAVLPKPFPLRSLVDQVKRLTRIRLTGDPRHADVAFTNQPAA